MRGDDGEKFGAVTAELDLADSGNPAHLVQPPRLVPGDLDQRAVVEDDIGRHPLLFRQRQAPRAQRLEQLFVARVGERLLTFLDSK